MPGFNAEGDTLNEAACVLEALKVGVRACLDLSKYNPMLGKEISLPKDKGMLGSVLLHLLLILLLVLPLIHAPLPPEEEMGLLVSLGLPDQGQGDEIAQEQNAREEVPSRLEETQTAPAPPPVPVKSQPVVQKEVITTEDPESINIRKAREEADRKQKEELLQQQREQAEAKRQSEEQARLRAEEESRKKAQYDSAKKQYGSLLSGGSGKGETGTPGNQGSPNGDPNAKNLYGVSTGSGMVGGGLGSRGVKYEPRISDDSQKVGKVVVNVCVDKAGKVISAEYTQKGSTTTDSDLRALAEKCAKKFVFAESSIEKQCGTITVDFRVQ